MQVTIFQTYLLFKDSNGSSLKSKVLSNIAEEACLSGGVCHISQVAIDFY